jgi:anion-transporting  ArsA/GET3 family ATPase
MAAQVVTAPAAVRDRDWDGVRLHVVTGKGGTGKTTVAAALALALAGGEPGRPDRRVLLIEVEGRQGLAQLFDAPHLGYDEHRLATAPGGGEVFGLAVEPKAALLEYLQMFYKLGRAGGLLERFGAIDFATTIAPGVRDVLLTGKVYEAVRRRAHGRPVYDAVVLDAPPTGRIQRFLNVNTDVAGLARVGPIRSQADSIMTLLRSPQTAVHLVTLLEEMPVQETVDAVTSLAEAGLPVGGVVVNLVRDQILPVRRLPAAANGRLDAEEVATGLAAAGLPNGSDDVQALLTEAAGHAQRVVLQRRERSAIDALGRPVYQLPALLGASGVDLGALYPLAETLREQGMA